MSFPIGPIGPTGLVAHLAFRDEDAPIPAGWRDRLEPLRARLPATPGNERVFGRTVDSRSLRFAQWSNSRICAVEAVDGIAARGVPFSRVGVVLSHCQVACVALAWDRGEVERPVEAGVDIELLGRAISDRAIERFATPAELQQGLAPLALWCIKEACFKADTAQDAGIVADYGVTRFNTAEREGSAVCRKDPSRSFAFRLSERSGCQIAVAAHGI